MWSICFFFFRSRCWFAKVVCGSVLMKWWDVFSFFWRPEVPLHGFVLELSVEWVLIWVLIWVLL